MNAGAFAEAQQHAALHTIVAEQYFPQVVSIARGSVCLTAAIDAHTQHLPGTSDIAHKAQLGFQTRETMRPSSLNALVHLVQKTKACLCPQNHPAVAQIYAKRAMLEHLLQLWQPALESATKVIQYLPATQPGSRVLQDMQGVRQEAIQQGANPRQITGKAC